MPHNNAALRDPQDALINLANDTASRALPRVTSLLWDGHKIWVKKSVGNKARTFHKIQKILSNLIPMPILRPTVCVGGSKGLETEVSRIEKFKAAGFTVPNVLATSDEWIVLSDVGLTVEHALKIDKNLSTERLEKLVTAAAQTLAKLHKSGIAHGRGSMNDMTYFDENTIGFIDLEEDIENANIPLPILMARDIFLFSVSVARFTNVNNNICEIGLNQYRKINENSEIFSELKKLLNVLRPFRLIISPFHCIIKSEPRRVYDAVTALIKAV